MIIYVDINCYIIVVDQIQSINFFKTTILNITIQLFNLNKIKLINNNRIIKIKLKQMYIYNSHRIPLTPKLSDKGASTHLYHTPKHSTIIHKPNHNNINRTQRSLMNITTNLNSQVNPVKQFFPSQRKNQSARHFMNTMKRQQNDQQKYSFQKFNNQIKLMKRQFELMSNNTINKQSPLFKNINSLKRKVKLIIQSNVAENIDFTQQANTLNSIIQKHIKSNLIVECITETELTVIQPPPIFRNQKYLSTFLRQGQSTSQSTQMIFEYNQFQNKQKLDNQSQKHVYQRSETPKQKTNSNLFCCMREDNNFMDERLIEIKKRQKKQIKRPFFN